MILGLGGGVKVNALHLSSTISAMARTISVKYFSDIFNSWGQDGSEELVCA